MSKANLEALQVAFRNVLGDTTQSLTEVAQVLRGMVLELGDEARRKVVTSASIGSIVQAAKVESIPQQLALTVEDSIAYKPKAKKAKSSGKKRGPKKLSPAHMKKLAVSREAYFKKMGYGKYAKKSKKAS